MRKPWAKPHEILATKFGRLTPLSSAPRIGRWLMWLCKCECGVERAFRQGHLVTGAARSCGCLSRETTSKLKTTHGQSRSGRGAEYSVWGRLRSRCNNARSPDYKDYGGRGITVCDRWDSFPAFLADMGPRPSQQHSIDRIDNDGPYSPDNCRWATRSTQARNTRNAVIVSLDGVCKPLKDWAETLGLDYKTMHRVLRRGDDICEWINKQQQKRKAA